MWKRAAAEEDRAICMKGTPLQLAVETEVEGLKPKNVHGF